MYLSNPISKSYKLLAYIHVYYVFATYKLGQYSIYKQYCAYLVHYIGARYNNLQLTLLTTLRKTWKVLFLIWCMRLPGMTQFYSIDQVCNEKFTQPLLKKLFTQPFIPQTTGLVLNYITSLWYQSWVPIMNTSQVVHEFSVLAEIAE